MDRTCVSTGRSPKPAVPRRLNAPTPNVGDRRGGNPRTNGVSFVHGYSGPQASRDGSSHFFESGQRRRLRWGRVESAPLMAAHSAGQHRVHSCDRRKGLGGPRRLGPGVQGSPQRERHCPRRQLESRVREAQVESSFWSGGWIAAQLRPPGQAVVRRTVPLRSLDDWLVPACYQ